MGSFSRELIIASVWKYFETVEGKEIVLLLDFDQQVFADVDAISAATNLLALSQLAPHTIFATTSASGEVKLSNICGMKALKDAYDSFKTTMTLYPFTFSEAAVYCNRLKIEEFHYLLASTLHL